VILGKFIEIITTRYGRRGEGRGKEGEKGRGGERNEEERRGKGVPRAPTVPNLLLNHYL